MVNIKLHRKSPRTPGGGKENSLPPPGVRGLGRYEYYFYKLNLSSLCKSQDFLEYFNKNIDKKEPVIIINSGLYKT
ncbi:MAG: hypothetical protein CVV49_18830 [Spirochaetae bacterium HGW-Spirochaetae-5]|nr:MAG: hypothetical protein CVV49_18830 [Spirochaetae bacterium HGW-Spirochaetae-5]